MAQAALGASDHRTSPAPATGTAVDLRASAVLTAAWIASDVVSVAGARYVTLRIKYTADAGGTANRAQLRVMTSAESGASNAAPAVSDDVWYPPTLVDSTPTATLLTGTKETGATGTILSPEHAVVVARPMAITLGEPSDAGTDIWHLKIKFDVGDDLWLYIAAKELGDTDADQLGILQVKYNLSM